MNIIYLETIDSTNTYAKLNIESIDDKTVISTDIQTNGYGRFNRSWVDVGTENIYMSFVLKPSEQMSEIYANLTQYLSVCLCKQLEGLGLTPKIKWPNDVLLDGKKVSGISAEGVIKNAKLKGIVLGIGVNLNASDKSLSQIDRPATSLNLELGKNISKKDFMEKLIEQFFKDYVNFLQNGFKLIKKDYEIRSNLSDEEEIKIAVFNFTKEGIFNGFDDNGNLILRLKNEKIESLNMGEIV